MSVVLVHFGGTPMRVSRPEGEPRGGVIVLHQAGGYAAQTERWITELAAEGYLAVAPILHHRRGVETLHPSEFGGDIVAFSQALPGDSSAREDIGAAIDYLSEQGVTPEHTGLVGFSFGGRAAYLVASERALGAAISFYGGGVQRENFPGNDDLPALAARTAELKTPFLGLFGEEDFMLSPGELDDWEAALAEASVAASLVRYPGAGHAFDVDEAFVPGAPSPYVADAANDATGRARSFLADKLA